MSSSSSTEMGNTTSMEMELLKFALWGVDLLAWPVIALCYPLFASIRAVETGSNYHMRKLVMYWTVFSLFSLFEFAFVKIIELYLPPYTSFLPVKDDEQSPLKLKKKRSNLMFSHLSYLAIFILLVCISERKSLRDDPINFSVLNIAFEVTSAYGNVGLTTGYGCDRQVKEDPKCVSKWYGFVGKWSDEAKLILIQVMIFGKLKKFNIKGGRMWKLV